MAESSPKKVVKRRMAPAKLFKSPSVRKSSTDELNDCLARNKKQVILYKEPTEDITFKECDFESGFLIKPTLAHIRIFPTRICYYEDHKEECLLNLEKVGICNQSVTYPPGCLSATHPIESSMIAYVINCAFFGAVRVWDYSISRSIDVRGSVDAQITDLQFKTPNLDSETNRYILAFIDVRGNVFVYRLSRQARLPINENEKYQFQFYDGLRAQLIFQINYDFKPKLYRAATNKFRWCHYVPSESRHKETRNDCSYQFALLINNRVYAGNLFHMMQDFTTSTSMSKLGPYFFVLKHDPMPGGNIIQDANFSADALVLATSAKDGSVKFFRFDYANVYFECEETFIPHSTSRSKKKDKNSETETTTTTNSPVSRILFLDDDWEFMLTLAENELKLWYVRIKEEEKKEKEPPTPSPVVQRHGDDELTAVPVAVPDTAPDADDADDEWVCSQTITFYHSVGVMKRLVLNRSKDLLLLGDSMTRLVYIIHLVRVGDAIPKFDWIQEFSLPNYVLNCNIRNLRLLKAGNFIQLERIYSKKIDDGLDEDSKAKAAWRHQRRYSPQRDPKHFHEELVVVEEDEMTKKKKNEPFVILDFYYLHTFGLTRAKTFFRPPSFLPKNTDYDKFKDTSIQMVDGVDRMINYFSIPTDGFNPNLSPIPTAMTSPAVDGADNNNNNDCLSLKEKLKDLIITTGIGFNGNPVNMNPESVDEEQLKQCEWYEKYDKYTSATPDPEDPEALTISVAELCFKVQKLEEADQFLFDKLQAKNLKPLVGYKLLMDLKRLREEEEENEAKEKEGDSKLQDEKNNKEAAADAPADPRPSEYVKYAIGRLAKFKSVPGSLDITYEIQKQRFVELTAHILSKYDQDILDLIEECQDHKSHVFRFRIFEKAAETKAKVKALKKDMWKWRTKKLGVIQEEE